MQKLSVVIPCYNEVENLPYLFDRLNLLREKLKEKFKLQFVFINDGSEDGTLAKLKNKSYEDCETLVLNHEVNKGLGEAIKTGFKAANGDFIATIDADCSYDPLELAKMLEEFDDRTDILIASPYHPEGCVKYVPWFRLFLSRNLSRIYRMFLGMKIYTYTSMFRIYRGEIVGRLDFHNSGHLSMVEILVDAYCKGCRIKEYPAELRERRHGKSKVNFGKEIKNHICFILISLRKRLFKQEKIYEFSTR
jgi:dolichol-phosphate mannosyltransferase